MCEKWRFKLRMAMVLAVLSMLNHNLSLCWSLNSEGLALLRFREQVVGDPFGALSNWNNYDGGEIDPCSWFGVECSDGKVIILNLKDLCLGGTLAPELGKLTYIKSIILRNNSFSGSIPVEVGELKELEVLDLGYNNFTGPFPSDIGNNLSLSILLLDSNKFLGSISPELYKLKMLSEFQVDESQLRSSSSRASCSGRSSSSNTVQPGDVAQRRLLQVAETQNSPSPSPSISLPPSSVSSPPESAFSPSGFLPPSPSPSPVLPPISASPAPAAPPISSGQQDPNPDPLPPPATTPGPSTETSRKSKRHMSRIWPGVIGGSVFVFISVIGIALFRSSKVVTVKPWTTGLSGQLQKAFVTGVPKLQRSELETACEDFSNIIDTLSDGTLYKGTLSSGVEIAVTCTAVKSAEDWTKNLEAQFRKKIETLSKVNHKNFVNLIGFCEEEEPFTRMMVFEYAPNGTLFEHIHIKESEHLDWAMRLRIAIGMAYCLEHMHGLNPPIGHGNLQTSSIYLTEDYAAKISDFSFWNEVTASKFGPPSIELLEIPSSDPETNVYSFGVVLFEILTGRLPYSVDNGSLADYLRKKQPLREMVDQTLKSFEEEKLEKLFELIEDCVHSDPKKRPTMRDVTARMREITAMEPEGATPKSSPLWWAELEILSTEAN